MAIRRFTNVPSRAEEGWEMAGPAYGGIGDEWGASLGYTAAATVAPGVPATKGAPAPGQPAAPTMTYPYTEELLEKGYTYTRGGGWTAPATGGAALPGTARAMGGRDLGAIGADDFSQYPVYGEEGGGTATRVSGGGGGGGLRYRPAVGRVTTQKTTFAGEFPEAPELRGVDKRRIKALTQKAMAPRLRLLRSALNRALVRSYENPNVRRMIVREALQGYGQGVEEARAGAEMYATGEARREQELEHKNLMLAYQNAMAKYQASAVKTTTQREIYDTEEARRVSGAPSRRVSSITGVGGGGFTGHVGTYTGKPMSQLI